MVGVSAWLRRRRCYDGPVYLISTLFFVSLLLVSAKWRIWWGGHCYGPRLLTDAMPCLILLVLPAMDLISRRPVLRASFGVLLGISVMAQAIGAFCYPNSKWDEAPVAVGERPSRLWDWRDSPISRSVAAGPRIGPSPGTFPKLKAIF
jgi:hypothetical protein